MPSPTQDNHVKAAGGGATSLTSGAFTIGGVNRYAILDAFSGAGTAVAANAAKIGGSGGTAMAIIGAATAVPSFFNGSRWGLKASPTGSQTAYASWGSTQDELFLICSTWGDVDQTTPVGTTATKSNNWAGAATFDSVTKEDTLACTTVAGDIMVDCFLSGSDPGDAAVLSLGNSQTLLEKYDSGTPQPYESLGMSYLAAVGTTTNAIWRVSQLASNTVSWVMFATPLKSVSAGGGATTKVMSDTLTTTDATVYGRRRIRYMTETQSLSDASVSWRRLVRVSSDAAVLIDEALRRIRFVRLISDTLSLSDSVVFSLRTSSTITKIMSEAVAVNDGALLVQLKGRSEETLQLSDGAVSGAKRIRVASEALTLFDEFLKTVIRNNSTVYTKVMSETLQLTEAVIRRAILVRNVADSILVYEDPYRLIQVTMNDLGLDMTDGFTEWARRVRQATDTILVTEDGVTRKFIITTEENIALSDEVFTWRRLKRLLTDNLTLFDTFSKTLAGANITYTKVMSDTTVVIDDAGRCWTRRTRNLAEGVVLSDEAIKALIGSTLVYTKVMSDTAVLSDAVVRALTKIRVLGDNLEFSDGVLKIRRSIKITSEDLALGDEAIRNLAVDQIYTVSISLGSFNPIRFGGR